MLAKKSNNMLCITNTESMITHRFRDTRNDIKVDI